ncbi:MAG: hypothetical protein J6V50_03955, partial [Clostridia bacterium]|nr:hypothetical protein [Clostridia bacterium]
MTNTIKIMKKVLTVVLSAAILCASLFVMPLFATAGTTYGEWLAQGIPNGDFEVGVEGAEPYGWSTTSLNYGIDAETASGDVIGFRSDAGAYYDEYSSKFDISTTDDSGNKIATITKKNPGYVALTSVAVPVTPSTAYTLSAMFKELEDNTDYVNNTAGITDANTALVIKEFATNDTTLTTDLSFKKLDSKVNSSEWQSLSGYFTTAETTNYIVVYLCVGSQWNVRNIVGFDNLALEKVGFNGNFDAGESNWTITSMNYDYSGSYNLYPGTYERYFSIGSVVDSGNRVLTLSKNV